MNCNKLTGAQKNIKQFFYFLVIVIIALCILGYNLTLIPYLSICLIITLMTYNLTRYLDERLHELTQ